MNDKVQNKIVEQKDIVKIINILNDFYKEKMEIFEKTKTEIEIEEQNYANWRNEKFNSNDIGNYPDFEYKTFNNKLNYGSLNFSFYCIDGMTYEDKTYAEAQTIMASGFSTYEKISIRLDLSWQKVYNQKEFYDDSNTASISASVTFFENDVYTNFSSKNDDADMKFLKSEISDVFDKLKPKYSNVISKREHIKYQSTLFISFFLSLTMVIVASFIFKKSGIVIDFEWWQIVSFLILSLVVNAFIPSTKISKLYRDIVPSKKTVYSNRQTIKIDNIKEFQRTAEVHIGGNATKSGKREQIEKISKETKIINIIVFILAVAVLFFVKGLI